MEPPFISSPILKYIFGKVNRLKMNKHYLRSQQRVSNTVDIKFSDLYHCGFGVQN